MSHIDPGDIQSPHTGERFDLEPLRRRLGGDHEAAATVIAAFRREAPRQLGRLNEAVLKAETAQVRLQAHSLKGSLLWIGAAAAAAAASALEKVATGDLPRSLQPEVAELTKQMDQLLSSLDSQSVAS